MKTFVMVLTMLTLAAGMMGERPSGRPTQHQNVKVTR